MTLHVTPIPTDAIGVLQQSRASVSQLLDAYAALCERGGETRLEKQAIVERLGLELTLNTQVEEEVLVPSLHVAAVDLSPLQALHDCAWALVAQMSMGDPGELRFDAKLLALGRDVIARLQLVHDVTLPLLPPSGIDLGEVGHRMMARKERLLEAFDRPIAEEEDEGADPVGQSVPGTLH